MLHRRASWLVYAASVLSLALGCGNQGGGQSAETVASTGGTSSPTTTTPSTITSTTASTTSTTPTTTPTPTPPPIEPPVTIGSFSFYGPPQNVNSNVTDVSPDEGGNVWVAASDQVLVRPAGAANFVAFSLWDAGITPNCHDPSEINVPDPVSPASPCPAIAVAGMDAGRVLVGLQGVGTDGDEDALWALRSGGMDLLNLSSGTPALERHVFVASPPGMACESWANPPTNTICSPGDIYWAYGRMKSRQIQRIVVNHNKNIQVSYLDAYVGGTHGTLSIFVSNPGERGFPNLTNNDPDWVDTYGVYEHQHPAVVRGSYFLTGESWALALDPAMNVPWFANQFRMASLPGYAQNQAPTVTQWWGDMTPVNGGDFFWIWEQAADPTNAALEDGVASLSFCPNGTLWVGSEWNGLAEVWPNRSNLEDVSSYGINRISTPAGTGGALAVACDPTDNSVWVGFSWGGFGRLMSDGSWQDLSWTLGVPAWALGPVRSIQIDTWSSPRVVWLAHLASKLGPAGVTSYDGP